MGKSIPVNQTTERYCDLMHACLKTIALRNQYNDALREVSRQLTVSEYRNNAFDRMAAEEMLAFLREGYDDDITASVNVTNSQAEFIFRLQPEESVTAIKESSTVRIGHSLSSQSLKDLVSRVKHKYIMEGA